MAFRPTKSAQRMGRLSRDHATRFRPDRACGLRHARRSAVQADGRRRGGWNTTIASCFGWRSHVSEESEDAPVEARLGTDAFHAQDSGCTSIAPAGTAGTVGCPEHNAPEQGRGDGGTEGPSESTVRSWNNGSITDLVRSELARDVTLWEQPAFATVGAIAHSTRSVSMAPAGRASGRLKVKDRVMTPGSGEHCLCILGNARNEVDQAREYEEPWIIYT
jgi:hypothetical protein